jgi:hypothetical protein
MFGREMTTTKKKRKQEKLKGNENVIQCGLVHTDARQDHVVRDNLMRGKPVISNKDDDGDERTS